MRRLFGFGGKAPPASMSPHGTLHPLRNGGSPTKQRKRSVPREQKRSNQPTGTTPG